MTVQIQTKEGKPSEVQRFCRYENSLAASFGERRWNVDGRIRNRHHCRRSIRCDSIQRRDRRFHRRGANRHHQSRTQHEYLGTESGFATVEAAIAIAALVATLFLCAAGISALVVQIQCVDAAREAARLAARGDEAAAIEAGRRVGPRGGYVHVRREGDFVIGTVNAYSRFLPGVRLGAEAIAVMEIVT